VTVLGDIADGHHAQVVARGGAWQGARLGASRRRGWALMTCFMAPGWDDSEFEPGERTALLRQFPGAAAVIANLTR